MAVFRVEKNSGYTVMSNHHLRNRALSLKAKGLLSQMLSLPEDWDYTLQGLARINRESIDAIRQAIRELEQAGYIQRSRERDEKGRLRGADYVIFELPQPVPASVSPTLENPTLENPTQENPTLENPMQLNKDKLITEKQKKEGLNTDSLPKLLLWLSRPSGTFCFRERDVLLKDTQAYNTWKFCGEQTHDRILAYAVELTGTANGTVQGNLYELDYQQHFQHIREVALPVGVNRLIYESGMREIGPKKHFDSRPDKYFGEFVRYEMQPRDPELLQAAIRQEQRSREPARHGDFKEHLAALHTGLIEAEAQRIVADMKRLAAPNSPDKNHFMVEVSPYFTKLASSRDTNQLLAMLPYKSLHLSSVKDRFGIYALIDKNENRDKGIRKPRASVRKQLSETKQTASPTKAAARSKQHEMEV